MRYVRDVQPCVSKAGLEHSNKLWVRLRAQLLVDTLLLLAPCALYPKLGVLTLLLSPILVVFYRGFLQLSKSLLDPFGNEDSIDENFNIHTLICETNAGAVRWMDAAEELPFEAAGGVGGKFPWSS